MNNNNNKCEVSAMPEAPSEQLLFFKGYPRGVKVCLQQAHDFVNIALGQIPRGPRVLGANKAQVIIRPVACVGHCQVQT